MLNTDPAPVQEPYLQRLLDRGATGGWYTPSQFSSLLRLSRAEANRQGITVGQLWDAHGMPEPGSPR